MQFYFADIPLRRRVKLVWNYEFQRREVSTTQWQIRSFCLLRKQLTVEENN